jgi:hypothetical protein
MRAAAYTPRGFLRPIYRSAAPPVLPAGGMRSIRVCKRPRGLPSDMSRKHPECADSAPPDRSLAADVLLRQEPDEEEDEEEDEGNRKEDDEDEDTDEGYSE